MGHRNGQRFVRFFLIILIICILLLAQAVYASELLLPGGLKRIEEQAFFGDASLDSVVVQEGTEVIGSQAFAQSSVKSVTLPGSLYSIADNAFAGCENLTVNAREGTYAYSWAVKNKYIKIEEGAEGEVTKVVVPETLRAGMNLTVQLFGPTDTIHHSIYIVNEQTGEYQYRDLTKATATATFDGCFFESDNTYRLRVYTVTRQYQTLMPVTKMIQISGQKPEGPVLDIPEMMILGQAISVKNNTNGKLKIEYDYYSADGTRINTVSNSVFAGESFWIETGLFNEYSDGGSIQVRYALYENGYWSEWVENQIMVSSYNYTVNLLNFPDTVENGQDFILTFDYEGYADYCNYNIIAENGEEIPSNGTCYLGNDSGTGDLQITTYRLDQGSYTLKMYFGVRQNGAYSLVYEKTFEVIGNRNNPPAVYADPVEIYADNYSTIVIDTSEADTVAIRQEYLPGYYSYYEPVKAEGPVTRWEEWFRSTEEYSFSVRRGGRWSAWSEPIEVLVKEKTKLASPNVYVDTPVNAGEDLTFTFDDVDNATHYSASLKTGYSDNSIYTLDPATPTDLNEIPGYMVSTGSYLFEVSASAENCETGVRKKYIAVSGTRPNGPDVQIDEPLHAGQDAVFLIDTQGAEALQVNYQMSYDGYSYRKQSMSVPVTGNMTEWRYSASQYWEGCDFTVSFSVQKDGVWSLWTTKTYIIMPPDPAVIHVEDEIAARTRFSITVDPMENATRYECRLYNSEGVRVWGYNYYSSMEAIQFNSANYGAGAYTFEVTVYGIGYHSVSKKTFIIAPLPPPDPATPTDL